MTFAFDGDPRVHTASCPTCARSHEAVTGFVLREGRAHAVYFARWYPDDAEAYVDVVLGSFHSDDAPDDAVMFGCRIGHVATQREPAASLVQAGAHLADNPRWGPRLDRTAALGHPRLRDFWAVVDWLILNDPTLHAHVYHLPPSPA